MVHRMSGTTPWLDPHALSSAEAIAQAAGALLLEGWGQRPSARTKAAATDLVTEFDGRAEALILDRLTTTFPTHGVVGEEGGQAGPADTDFVWYVDPLDGTMNFVHGLPFFAVSMGLVVEGEPVLGVVHAPVLGWTFSAVRGGKARLNDDTLRVSNVGALPDGLFGTGFPYVAGQPNANLPEFTAFLHNTHGVRRLGSAALDLAFVAAGWFDGYWERHIKAWDLAAGAALVVAAGGRVTDLDGGTLDVRSGRIVATNGLIHEQTVNLLRAAHAAHPTP